jgi:hypothetical protein
MWVSMVHGMAKILLSPHFIQHQQGHALMQGMQGSVIITSLKWFRPKSSV